MLKRDPVKIDIVEAIKLGDNLSFSDGDEFVIDDNTVLKIRGISIVDGVVCFSLDLLKFGSQLNHKISINGLDDLINTLKQYQTDESTIDFAFNEIRQNINNTYENYRGLDGDITADDLESAIESVFRNSLESLHDLFVYNGKLSLDDFYTLATKALRI